VAFPFLFWRTQVRNSWKSLLPEIIKTAKYIKATSLLDCLTANALANDKSQEFQIITRPEIRTMNIGKYNKKKTKEKKDGKR